MRSMTALPDPTDPVVLIRLVGGFELVTRDGTYVDLPRPAQRLLAVLVLHHRRVTRPYAAGTLWPESSEEHALASLRTTLWRLRELAGGIVDASKDVITLSQSIHSDVEQAIDISRGGIEHLEPYRVSLIREQLSADLLPGWYDEWVVPEREWFRQLRLHALDRLCHRLTVARNFADAVEIGLAAVAADPLRESSHRELIAAHLAEGNVNEAVRQYRIVRRLLHEELNVSPSRDTQALISSVTSPD
jgi:DNA-binding SARP family transcriptional activator